MARPTPKARKLTAREKLAMIERDLSLQEFASFPLTDYGRGFNAGVKDACAAVREVILRGKGK